MYIRMFSSSFIPRATRTRDTLARIHLACVRMGSYATEMHEENVPSTPPAPPYCAVISTSLHARTSEEEEEYNNMSAKMSKLVTENVPGFIAYESVTQIVREDTTPPLKKTIATTYFESLEDLQTWRTMDGHQKVKQYGKKNLYLSHNIRVCMCIEDYGTGLTQIVTDRELAYPTRRSIHDKDVSSM